jgi:hypothetical protein
VEKKRIQRDLDPYLSVTGYGLRRPRQAHVHDIDLGFVEVTRISTHIHAITAVIAAFVITGV